MGGWPFAAVSTSNLNCSVVSPRRTRSEKPGTSTWSRSEEHTSELQSPCNLVCRLLLEKKKKHGASAYRRTISVLHLWCCYYLQRFDIRFSTFCYVSVLRPVVARFRTTLSCGKSWRSC